MFAKNCACVWLQTAGGGGPGGCRGAETEDWTAAKREATSPGGEQHCTSAFILQVARISRSAGAYGEYLWSQKYLRFKSNLCPNLSFDTSCHLSSNHQFLFIFCLHRKSKDDTWVSNNTYWELRKDSNFSHIAFPILWWLLNFRSYTLLHPHSLYCDQGQLLRNLYPGLTIYIQCRSFFYCNKKKLALIVSAYINCVNMFMQPYYGSVDAFCSCFHSIPLKLRKENYMVWRIMNPYHNCWHWPQMLRATGHFRCHLSWTFSTSWNQLALVWHWLSLHIQSFNI